MRCVTNVSVSWTTSRIFASPRKFHDKICRLEASAKAGCLLGGLILGCYMKRDLQRVRAERKEDSVLISVRDLAVLSTEFSACYSVNTWVGNFASETRVYATPITETWPRSNRAAKPVNTDTVLLPYGRGERIFRPSGPNLGG